MIVKKAQHFFETKVGEKITSWTEIPQSGSSRINFIADSAKGRFVITYNENLRENESFFYFSEIFSELRLNTPKIIAISDDRLLYIQDYLGNQTLSQIIEKHQESDFVKQLVKQSLEKLHHLQVSTKDKIDYSKTFEYERYDELPVLHDLFYFKNFFVDVLELPYHKSTLLLEFKQIVENIEHLQPKGLMIRDFQARNILVNENNQVSFIDYQSAMEGPMMYDVVSFLFQAKANFSEDFKIEMLEYYIQQFDDVETQQELRKAIPYMQLIRFLQVLGAYGFRGLIQRKSHFISSIQKGIENIVAFSKNWPEMNQFPELKTLIAQLETQSTRAKIEQITQK